MKKSKMILWLYKELPALVTNGIVSEDAAGRIKNYYGEVAQKSKLQTALAIFMVIGMISVGLGVILIFAHNWDNLPRFTRTLLAFFPTIVSAALVAWLVLKDKDDAGLKEGAGIFNMLSVGATISLVSQIYHIPGDISSFLLVWMLITVPLVYLLSVSLPAVAYLIGITVWAACAQSEYNQAVLFWPLSFVVLPYYIKNIFNKPNASQWVSAALFLSYTIAIGVCLEKAVPGLWTIIYSAFFAAAYLTGALWHEREGALWAVPFRRYGIAGITVLAYIFSYRWPWREVGWRYYRTGVNFVEWATIIDYIILLVFIFTAIYFLMQMAKKKRSFETLFGSMPVVAVLGFAISGTSIGDHLAGAMFTLYVLALGVVSILTGVKERKLAATNAGILIVAVIMLSRFLEFDVDIITRALAFIFVGICFLAANAILAKKIKRGQNA